MQRKALRTIRRSLTTRRRLKYKPRERLKPDWEDQEQTDARQLKIQIKELEDVDDDDDCGGGDVGGTVRDRKKWNRLIKAARR